MYKTDNSPQGLFIEKQKVLSPLDTSSGNGNFYLKPNGVFYITAYNIPVSSKQNDHRNRKMTGIKFQIVQPGDNTIIQFIADRYLSEWNIPKDKTIERLQSFTGNDFQFQVLMTLDSIPIATGGLYNHVGLLDKEPRFRIYENWLALVYAIPGMRHRGFGALICAYINDYSKTLGVKEMYLYTDTAERLYTRLGWNQLERLSLGERNIVVMKKDL
ncbi:MAG: hypothetical protein ABI863_11090 [Ginsengibacter sp.]